MELFFVTEARFIRTGNGEIHALDSASGKAIWERYLEVFDFIRIAARVKKDENFTGVEATRVDSPRVSFLELPYYIGPVQYLKHFFSLRRILQKECNRQYAYICRNGQLAALVTAILKKRRIPYGLEVVGDPWDVFAPGASRSRLRCFFRYWFLLQSRAMVRNSSAVLYVTKQSLQRRYPPRPNCPEFGISDVMISRTDFAKTPKHYLPGHSPCRLICVGSLAQPYKAPDIVLKALQLLKEAGESVTLTWLGDGRFREEMVQLAQELGVADRAFFVGNIAPVQRVREYLREADVFVQVSRVDGLPRSVGEAMSEGLPCIGSRVGGIPELLEEEMLVPVDNAQALAAKVSHLIHHPQEADWHAARNLEEAHAYADETLSEKRRQFFQTVKNLAEKRS